MAGIETIDKKFNKSLDKIRGNKFFDNLFYYASEIADYSIGWQVLGLLLLINPNTRNEWFRLIVLLAFESLLVNQGIKRLTKRERPKISSKLTKVPRRPKTSSFPSGHSSSATLSAILLSDSLPAYTGLWIFLAALVIFSRLYNSMHYLSDVLAGIILGALLAYLGMSIWPL